MSEGLCWKCKEALMKIDISLRGSELDVRPYLHCHHEPKEKPAERCWWCQEPGERKVTGGELNFCPRCGRKL